MEKMVNVIWMSPGAIHKLDNGVLGILLTTYLQATQNRVYLPLQNKWMDPNAQTCILRAVKNGLFLIFKVNLNGMKST